MAVNSKLFLSAIYIFKNSITLILTNENICSIQCTCLEANQKLKFQRNLVKDEIENKFYLETLMKLIFKLLYDNLSYLSFK